MKLQYKPIEKETLGSIHVRRVREPYVDGNWHFHREFELIYFLKGQGTRIVGDHISNFDDGELVFVGEWLPHLWRNDAEGAQEDHADFIVVKFPGVFEDVDLFSLPEMTDIRSLLHKARRGIWFSVVTRARIHQLLLELSECAGVALWINLLRILQILAGASDYRYLSSPGFTLSAGDAAENRLREVINYISANYHRPIALEEIAQVVFLTPPAFCRFFKNRTGKTFSHFLNEVRVSKACQLLMNGEKPVKEICYEVGFSSLTNFNRSFRSFREMTPTDYRDRYRHIRP